MWEFLKATTGYSFPQTEFLLEPVPYVLQSRPRHASTDTSFQSEPQLHASTDAAAAAAVVAPKRYPGQRIRPLPADLRIPPREPVDIVRGAQSAPRAHENKAEITDYMAELRKATEKSTPVGIHSTSLREAPTVHLQENLMYDHGLLKRALFCLRHALQNILDTIPSDNKSKKTRRKHSQNSLKTRAATIHTYNSMRGIIRAIMEIFAQYIHPIHEEAEEKFIFEPCIDAGLHVAMVKKLWEQHHIAKKLTQQIADESTQEFTDSNFASMARAIHELTEMYEYHEAIEDTVIFPEFYSISKEDEIQRSLFNDYITKDRELMERCLNTIQVIEYELKISLNTVTPSTKG